MLDDFLQTNAIDFLCLQEMTSSVIDQFRDYVVHLNIGTEGRGTAVIHKDIYSFAGLEKLPTDRVIKGTFDGLTVVNIYVPSGNKNLGSVKNFLT
jgi:exonuclease III